MSMMSSSSSRSSTASSRSSTKVTGSSLTDRMLEAVSKNTVLPTHTATASALMVSISSRASSSRVCRVSSRPSSPSSSSIKRLRSVMRAKPRALAAGMTISSSSTSPPSSLLSRPPSSSSSPRRPPRRPSSPSPPPPPPSCWASNELTLLEPSSPPPPPPPSSPPSRSSKIPPRRPSSPPSPPPPPPPPWSSPPSRGTMVESRAVSAITAPAASTVIGSTSRLMMSSISCPPGGKTEVTSGSRSIRSSSRLPPMSMPKALARAVRTGSADALVMPNTVMATTQVATRAFFMLELLVRFGRGPSATVYLSVGYRLTRSSAEGRSSERLREDARVDRSGSLRPIRLATGC